MYIIDNIYFSKGEIFILYIAVSHTTDEMVFQWDPEVPIIVVEENIELPQLQLVENRIADCTQVYSTGMFSGIFPTL